MAARRRVSFTQDKRLLGVRRIVSGGAGIPSCRVLLVNSAPLSSCRFRFTFYPHLCAVLLIFYSSVVSPCLVVSPCFSLRMSVSGITGCPSRCCLRISASFSRRLAAFPSAGKSNERLSLPRLDGFYWVGSAKPCNGKQFHLVKSAMDASYGSDMTNGQPVIFPRIHVRDPYKRLGISREASEEEIQSARNFLINKYGGHKPSVDAIESAHDKIIMQKFYERRNPKIDIKKKVREVKQSRVVQAVTSRFQTPATLVIIKTSLTFLVLGVLTYLYPTEEGPTLQVALSLMATIYFIYDRLKSKLRAFLYGAGAFIFSWLFGTFLMVSVIPPLPFIKGLRSFEVITSLITYVLLWISSTYLK